MVVARRLDARSTARGPYPARRRRPAARGEQLLGLVLALICARPTSAQPPTSSPAPPLERSAAPSGHETRVRARYDRELARGRAHAAAGHHALAIDYFRAAIRLAPDIPLAHDALAGSLIQLSRTHEAIGILERALVRMPAASGLRRTLADAWLDLGDTQRALDVLRVAREREPSDISLLLMEAEVAERAGALMLAANDYAAILDEARTGQNVSPDEERRAQRRLRALALLLGSRHPATACVSSRTATEPSDLCPFGPSADASIGASR